MADDRKTFTLGELFTPAELAKAGRIVKASRLTSAVNQIEAEIVKPAMTRIDKVTGQANSSRYFAYLLLHHLS